MCLKRSGNRGSGNRVPRALGPNIIHPHQCPCETKREDQKSKAFIGVSEIPVLKRRALTVPHPLQGVEESPPEGTPNPRLDPESSGVSAAGPVSRDQDLKRPPTWSMCRAGSSAPSSGSLGEDSLERCKVKPKEARSQVTFGSRFSFLWCRIASAHLLPR